VIRGFRHAFATYTPKWLSNRAGKNVGYRVLYAMIFPLDVAVQAVVDGIRASWPGLGTPTALAMIGFNRGILRGEAESDAAYGERLIPWLDGWAENDSLADEQMARQIQAYLGNTPMVRVVSRNGMTLTVDQSGNASFAQMAWDWDSKSNPERANQWSDQWIIIYPTEWAIAPTVAARATSPHDQGYGLGHLVQRPAVDAIRSIVHDRKGAHACVRNIIWSYDPTLFVPGSPVAGNPDGTWGCSSILVGGPAGQRVPNRNPNCRYWDTEKL